MKPLVKICGMRESENILSVAKLRPDLMGFIFYPRSPRYAAGFLDPDLLSSLGHGIIRTGVFVDADYNDMIVTARQYSLDAVQLHGNESPDLCRQLKNTGLRVIKTFRISDNNSFLQCGEYSSCTDLFLFDTPAATHGGSGLKFDWKLLEGYQQEHPFLLGGGIGPDDAADIQAIDNHFFRGVDLNSRFEISPGTKETGKLRKFINELRANLRVQ